MNGQKEELVDRIRQHLATPKPLDDLTFRLLEEAVAAIERLTRTRETTDQRQASWAALRMIRDAIGELFGPTASIESEEAVLLRGPEHHHEAEAIIDALKTVATAIERPTREREETPRRGG